VGEKGAGGIRLLLVFPLCSFLGTPDLESRSVGFFLESSACGGISERYGFAAYAMLF
jgi:hypothetical protein